MLPLLLAFAIDAPNLERDILPLFAKHCSGCHAKSVTMGSLDLETYEGIRKGGNHGTIVVPGKPKESRLYTMLTGEASPAMPMNGKILASQEIALVSSWIAAGAAGPVKNQTYSMTWMPDGKSVVLGGFRQVTFSDGRPAWTGFADAVRAVAVSSDGKTIVGAGGSPGRKGEVKIQGGAEFAGHADCIYALAISPDGKTIATASYDKFIKLWDATSGKEIRTLKDHIDAIYALAFTPDGKRLISGAADRTIKVWNPETGERLYTMGEPTDGINTIAISPDGKLVAAGGLDKSIRMWRLGEKGAEPVSSQIAHEDAILKLAFSPDGKRLVSAAADRSMKTFSVPELGELKIFPPQSDWVTGLGFSPDGKQLAVARIDGSFQLIPMEEQAK